MGKKSTNILFLLKQPVCVDKLKVRKTIVIINFSVLDFFKFVSRMPQIAQILVSTFKIFQVGVGDTLLGTRCYRVHARTGWYGVIVM